MANGKITMELGEAYPMNGGDGPYSYAQNSLYQRKVVDASKGMISEAIFEKLDIENSPLGYSNTIKIADLGCSVGPNAFLAVQNLIEAIEIKYKSKSTVHHQEHDGPQNPEESLPNDHPDQTLEFQVFFNDLTDNDFNTLFKTLPTSRRYFVAGVPGSFHRRLFPEATLHVAYSYHALHWLSRVPEEVVDRNSPAWNKGRVHYTGNAKILEAYSAQFKRDMEAFFSARAQEIVDGGLLLLYLPGCQDGFLPSDTSTSMQLGLFGSCLMDMVKMGVISEENVDSFNLPMYLTSPMEFRELIEANGYFHIEKMENFNPYVLDELPDFRILSTHFRAATEGLITQYFGSEIIDELFERYAKKMAEHSYVFDVQHSREFIIFACLKRKL